MFGLFKKKIPLEIGQVWELPSENPFVGRWRTKIVSLQKNYVAHIPFYFSKDDDVNSFLENVALFEHYNTEKEFRDIYKPISE